MSMNQARDHLLFALLRVLKPVTRLLMRAGIRADEFADLAAEVYVDCATREHPYPEKPSRERIAILTGLCLRQVDLYVDQHDRLQNANQTLMSLVVQVLQKWHTNPEYVGPYGIPRELEFSTPPDRCFRSLVASVNPNANPHDVLAEVLRAGTVAQSTNKRLRAISRSLMLAESMSPQLIEYYGNGLARVATTLEHNLDPRNPERRLARRVIADRGLTPALVEQFDRYARGRATEVLLEMDNWLAAHASNDSNKGDRVDAGVYIFFYSESPLRDEALSRVAE